MSNIYGGDEVNSIVVDVGSCLCKAGYGGDDVPKAIFPSQVGVGPVGEGNGMEVDVDNTSKANGSQRKLYVGQQAVNFRRDGMEVATPFNEDGLLSDWDAVEELWGHVFKDRLRINPSEYAMLMAEPAHNTREVREKMVELMFEKFDCPALFLARNSVLSAFATAKQTALVVDSGHEATTVSAVQDGYLLTKSVIRSPLAGQTLTKAMLQAVRGRGVNVRPRYSIKRTEKPGGDWHVEEVKLPDTTSSFHTFQVEQVVADIKESICRTSESAFDEVANANIPTVSYELPDGQEIQLGPERLKIPELLFNPSLLSDYEGLSPPPASAPLQSLVLDAINRCDVDVRKELFSGVVLTGGTSLLHGLRDRLDKELSAAAPTAAKIKVWSPVNTLERRFSVWLGGSILSSLGSFQQMWMSKEEYDEAGAALIHKKAP